MIHALAHRQQGLLLTGGGALIVLGTLLAKGLYERRIERRLLGCSAASFLIDFAAHVRAIGSTKVEA